MPTLYHYCISRSPIIGTLAYATGVIETNMPINTKERYAEVIQQLVDSRGWDVTETVILSLSLLGSVDNG